MEYVTVLSANSGDNVGKALRKEFPRPELDESAKFFEDLGRCIAAWQLVEASLFMILEQLIGVGAREADALSAAFHSATNFRGRLEMVDAAAKKAMPNEELLKIWAAIHKKAGNKAIRRNAIAHSVVTFDPGRNAEQGRMFLGPNMMDSKRRSQPIIHQRELIDARDAFLVLYQRLVDLRMQIYYAKHPPKPA